MYIPWNMYYCPNARQVNMKDVGTTYQHPTATKNETKARTDVFDSLSWYVFSSTATVSNFRAQNILMRSKISTGRRRQVMIGHLFTFPFYN